MLKKTLLILIVVSFLIPFQAMAFEPFDVFKKDHAIVPCGRAGTKDCTLCDIFELLKNIINLLLAVVLIFAPIFILGGGIMLLTSAGVPDRVTLGKKIITSAIIGMVIAMGAWTILGTFFNVLILGKIGISEVGPLQVWVEGWAWNEFHCTP